MKKLMMTALGLGLALGSVSFAQDAAPKMDSTTTPSTTTKKPKKAKKMKKPATDTSTTSTDKKM